MAPKEKAPKYLVISPVKDEEQHVEWTLRSMIQQEVKPLRWIIVDDGSCDRIAAIVERYAAGQDFIQLVRSCHRNPRQPGSGVIRAFQRGFELAKGLNYNFVVKLDCDLSFDPHYFDRIFKAFAADPKLGIASGVYMESTEDGEWAEVEMPSYHAAGASKVIRRQCFEEIGGFVPSRGWDTVDEIRAMARGWRTGHCRDLKMKHWKREGAGIGSLRTNLMHGEIYYLTGGSRLFLLLKVLHRMMCRPFLIGGLALLWGYVWAALGKQEPLVTADEARCYRALLHSRMAVTLRNLLPAG